MPVKKEGWKGIISSLFKKKEGEFDDDDEGSIVGPKTANASVTTQASYTEKPTASPEYAQALKHYLSGDNQQAANVALAAIRKNPKDKEAMGLLNGLARKGDYGYKIEQRVSQTKR